MVLSARGYILFDDTVLDKHHSRRIELVRRQYSGNAYGVIAGIGLVNCVYINPEMGQFWLIDYRLFAPDTDGKTFYCPLKNNRLIDDSGGQQPDQPVGCLSGSGEEVRQGKTLKVKGMPKHCKLKIFRVLVSTHRTDYLLTNEVERCDTAAAEHESSVR